MHVNQIKQMEKKPVSRPIFTGTMVTKPGRRGYKGKPAFATAPAKEG